MAVFVRIYFQSIWSCFITIDDFILLEEELSFIKIHFKLAKLLMDFRRGISVVHRNVNALH